MQLVTWAAKSKSECAKFCSPSNLVRCKSVQTFIARSVVVGQNVAFNKFFVALFRHGQKVAFFPPSFASVFFVSSRVGMHANRLIAPSEKQISQYSRWSRDVCPSSSRRPRRMGGMTLTAAAALSSAQKGTSGGIDFWQWLGGEKSPASFSEMRRFLKSPTQRTRYSITSSSSTFPLSTA